MTDASPQLQHSRRSASSKMSGPQILSFPLEKRPKARRASLPKVRTGCITCKKRHVKCDESKPSCDRCVRWRGYCGGYNDSPSSCVASDSESDQSLPPRISDEHVRHAHGPPDPSSSDGLRSWDKTPAPPQPVFRESYFKQLYAADLVKLCKAPVSFNTTDGLFPGAFWTHDMHAILQDSPCVLFANLAVQAIGLCQRPNPRLFGRAFSTENARTRAFQYYGIALRCIGRAGASRGDLRNAILCSLFCVCFEILQKDNRAAESHFHGGQRMANELMRVDSPAAVRRVRASLSWELHNVLSFCKFQEEAGSIERWRDGFERYGSRWLGRDWRDEESWTETPLMEWTIVPMTAAIPCDKVKDLVGE